MDRMNTTPDFYVVGEGDSLSGIVPALHMSE
ncbi:hypothetical protein J2X68_005719 [Streptomyces sp. 3330]|nr:hypothetical protein [Streptomyces sp. 3330]